MKRDWKPRKLWRRKKKRPAPTCPSCKSSNVTHAQRTFQNGTQHWATTCADCGKFIRWSKKRDTGRDADCIRYPGMASEFEVQAFLWHELKGLDYDVRGEVPTDDDRFDLVVFEQRRAVRIIEVKKHVVNRLDSIGKYKQRKQIGRYKRFGLPVDVIAGMKNARAYIGYVKEHGLPEGTNLLAHHKGIGVQKAPMRDSEMN